MSFFLFCSDQSIFADPYSKWVKCSNYELKNKENVLDITNFLLSALDKPDSEEQPWKGKSKRKPLLISISEFEKQILLLKESLNLADEAYICRFLVSKILNYVNNFSIVIDCEDIFLRILQQKESPHPEVTSRWAYKITATIFLGFVCRYGSNFSIQDKTIEKAIIPNNPSKIPGFLPFCQPVIKYKGRWINDYDLTLPINEFYYFNTAFEAYQVSELYQILGSKPYRFFKEFTITAPKRLSLAFKKEVPPSDLADYLPLLNQDELILIFKDSEYQKPQLRADFYEEICHLIKQTQCTSFLHIFLITHKLPLNLMDLNPNFDKEQQGFSPLTQDCGYYLSAACVFDLINQNRQEKKGAKFKINYSKWAIEPKEAPKEKEANTFLDYVYKQEKGPNFRKTKELSAKELQASLKLNIKQELYQEQAEQLNQEQVLEQEEELSKALEISQNQQIRAKKQVQSGYFLFGFDNFDMYLNMIYWHAEMELHPLYSYSYSYSIHHHFFDLIEKERNNQEDLALETERYKNNFSKQSFYQKIIKDKQYRTDYVAKLLGRIYIQTPEYEQVLNLPNFSVNELMESYHPDDLINSRIHYGAFYLPDGLDFNHDNLNIETDAFFGKSRVVTNWANAFSYNYSAKDFKKPYCPFPSLSLVYQDKAFGDHPGATTLLCNADEQNEALIASANQLLSLFKTKAQDQERPALESLKQALIQIIQFNHPKLSEKEQNNLKELLSLFQSLDDIRIIIYLMLCSKQEALPALLNYLDYFKKRALLKPFYKIYFEYASHINSLEKLFSQEADSFLQLAQETPLVESKEQWPCFIKFAFHTLIFVTKNQASNCFQNYTSSFEYLKSFWQYVSISIHAYAKDDKKALQLMNLLAQNLTSEEDLALKTLRHEDTLFRQLPRLLEHAIENCCLEEQITELKNLSLLPTDVPYAIKYNGFRIVCQEMNLYGQKINIDTASYEVNSVDLLKRMKKGNSTLDLKTSVFRYLGQEELRLSLAYYRHLFDLIQADLGLEVEYFHKELFLCFYILKTTGKNSYSRLEPESFVQEFLQNKFLPDAPLKNFDDLLDFTRFFLSKAAALKEQEITNHCSLQRLWKEQEIDINIPLPTVLSKEFEKKRLYHFLLENQQELKNFASTLKSSKDLTLIVLKTILQEHPNEIKALVLQLQHLLNPEFHLERFIDDIEDLGLIIHLVNILNDSKMLTHVPKVLLDVVKEDNRFFLALASLLTEALCTEEDLIINADQSIAYFLSLLTMHSYSPETWEKDNPLLALALNYVITTQLLEPNLSLVVALSTQLRALEAPQNLKILSLLLKGIKTPEIYQFLIEVFSVLNLNQIEHIALILETLNHSKDCIPLFQIALKEQEAYSFQPLLKLLRQAPKTNQKQLLYLLNYHQGHLFAKSLAQGLAILQQLESKDLAELVWVHQLHQISSEDCEELIRSHSLSEAISQYERKQYNLEHQEEKIALLEQKIGAIEFKGWGDLAPSKLNERAKNCLLDDYQQLMSLRQQPIYINKKGETLRVSELNKEQCQFLVKKLNKDILKGKEVHQNQLKLLCIALDVMYRTTHKYPRNTQILVVVNNLLYNGWFIIHEVQTGEGKSIISALLAVMRCDLKTPVDIVTENISLAAEGLERFSSFYNYLGVKCALKVIQAQSIESDYCFTGINYSTASNLALFKVALILQKKLRPGPAHLICDEIDATLNSLVEYRLAATVDPLLLETKSWTILYQALNQFIQEDDLFKKNFCDSPEDVTNFKLYLLQEFYKDNLKSFISKLGDERISEVIDSAVISSQLLENQDFRALVQKRFNKVFFYAAPIIESRPDPKVSYGNSVQQLLHSKLNQELKNSNIQFEIKPDTETLIALSAKNFFDGYRMNGGSITGLTGTAGSEIELTEFAQEHGLIAFSYPSYHENLCQDMGVFYAFGIDSHLELVLQKILERQSIGPILIITESPKETYQLFSYLLSKKLHNQVLQCYHGYEDEGISEKELIIKAGLRGLITVANESLARGADIDTDFEEGLWVINTCVNLTDSGLRQIKGRAARNGKKGSFCSIINAEKLGISVEQALQDEEVIAHFSENRKAISISEQKERIRRRLLEECRKLAMDHFLELKFQVDTLLNRQYGAHTNFVETGKLNQKLSLFNKTFESLYEEDQSNEEFRFLFISKWVAFYNTELKELWAQWNLDNFEAQAPLVPIAPLYQLKSIDEFSVKGLQELSQLTHLGWSLLGHQKMLFLLKNLDVLLINFEPYFSKKHTLKYTCCKTLIDGGWIKEKDLLEKFSQYRASIQMCTEEEIQQLEDSDILPKIVTKQLIKLINKYSSKLINYLQATEQHIRKQDYDQLELPPFISLKEVNKIGDRFVGFIETINKLPGFMNPIELFIDRSLISKGKDRLEQYFEANYTSPSDKILTQAILNDLPQLSSKLAPLINLIILLIKREELTLDKLLSSILPLLTDDLVLKIIENFLKLRKKTAYIEDLYFIKQILLDVDDQLKPYKNLTLSELIQGVEVNLQGESKSIIPFLVDDILIPKLQAHYKDRPLKYKELLFYVLHELPLITLEFGTKINLIYSDYKQSDITPEWVLNSLKLLMNNKALFKAISRGITQYQELVQQHGASEVAFLNAQAVDFIGQWIPIESTLDYIKRFFSNLELKEENDLGDFLDPVILKHLLNQFANFSLVQHFISGTAFEAILKALTSFNFKESFTLKKLSLHEFIALFKVVSHPEFHAFLEQLPGDMDFRSLVNWLEKDSEAYPLTYTMKMAKAQLEYYQEHNADIAKQEEQKLFKLKLDSELSVEQVEQELERLKPKVLKDMSLRNDFMKSSVTQVEKRQFLIGLNRLPQEVVDEDIEKKAVLINPYNRYKKFIVPSYLLAIGLILTISALANFIFFPTLLFLAVSLIITVCLLVVATAVLIKALHIMEDQEVDVGSSYQDAMQSELSPSLKAEQKEEVIYLSHPSGNLSSDTPRYAHNPHSMFYSLSTVSVDISVHTHVDIVGSELY